ncbi:TIGR03086 family metal-binding protein [Labedaea rhizosphaerae]|uniref:Uncharacterized protein (TIGR03086 family) n=1 Tax=Labedaea rhizosphaerae TaxID=598644 RepID=A0A4R6RRB3_LABRH|nr:TIGR03086 family metal-binding protein [Labedaea rhizosphaerae]TDP89369.1 uncharacterized protein (TIGR03086 family) [Labedaea rhizosphaerae]
MPNPPLDQLTDAVGDFEKLLAGIGADQWALPSPCSEWTVRQVANHVQFGNRQFAAAVAGTPEGPWRKEADDDLLGDKPVAAFRDLADAMLVAFGQPGALERIVTVGIGSVPGIVALHLRIVELLVHGWDLARATGQQPAFDEDTAAQAYAFTEAKLADVPEGRRSFAPPRPAPAGASALDRLAALLGRDVG